MDTLSGKSRIKSNLQASCSITFAGDDEMRVWETQRETAGMRQAIDIAAKGDDGVNGHDASKLY
jgi:hypothetical protein